MLDQMLACFGVLKSSFAESNAHLCTLLNVVETLNACILVYCLWPNECK